MQIAMASLLGGDSGPATTFFTMDTPMARGSAKQTHVTRMLGHALSNKELASLDPSAKRNAALTRANNLANLTAQTLLGLKAEARENALTQLAGLSFTSDVLSFAKALPEQLSATDAVRFSLGIHCLHGLVDMEAGRQTSNAQGYRGLARFFKDVQNRRKQSVVQSARLSGLGLPAIPGTTQTSSGLPPIPGTTASSGGFVPPAPKGGAVTKGGTSALLPVYTPSQMNLQGEPVGADSLCKRWSPTTRCFPTPADIEPETIKFQADACRGGVDLRPVSALQQDKLIGIRMQFKAIFGREPNNAEASYFGRMKWCLNAKGEGTALVNKMLKTREAVEAGYSFTALLRPTEGNPFGITPDDFAYRDYGSDIGQALAKAANSAFDFLGKSAQFVSDILCKGFKALLGEQVGAVICDIIDFITRAMVSGIAAIVDVITESLRGTVEFVQLMMKGKVQEAFEALLRSMGRVLFALSAPIMVPVLMADKGQGRSMADAFAELKVRADRVTKKEPLWPLMVIIAVVGMFSVVSGNVLGATTALISALAPMLATFISEPLMRLPELATSTLEEVEGGIVKFVKFIVLIVNGAMAIKDMVGKFRGQLMAYFKKSSAASLTGGANANAAGRIKYVLEKITAAFNVLSQAFAKVNIKDMSQAAEPILTLIPDLLLAILPDDAKESIPTLTEWRDAVKKSTASVNEAEATLRAGAQDLFKTFTLDQKINFIQDGVKEIPAQNVAQVTAQMLAAQFRNQSTYPAFKAALRAELLKA